MSLVNSSLCISNITSIVSELNLICQFHYMQLNCGNIQNPTYGLLDLEASMKLPNWWMSQWADDAACSSGCKRPWMVLSSLGPATVTRLNWRDEKDVCFWSSQARPVAQNKQNFAQILFLEYISAKGKEVSNPVLEQEWYRKCFLVKSPKTCGGEPWCAPSAAFISLTDMQGSISAWYHLLFRHQREGEISFSSFKTVSD